MTEDEEEEEMRREFLSEGEQTERLRIQVVRWLACASLLQPEQIF